MAAIQMSGERQTYNQNALPMSQKRAREKAVRDLEDEREVVEEEEDEAGPVVRREVEMRGQEDDGIVDMEIAASPIAGLSYSAEAEYGGLGGSLGKAQGGNGKASEVVDLTMCSPTTVGKARSPSIVEVLEAVEAEVEPDEPDEPIEVALPRRSGRNSKQKASTAKTSSAPVQRVSSMRATRSPAINSNERPNERPRRTGRAPPPISLVSTKTSRASIMKSGKSSSSSPVPYIELPSLSPAQLSAYKDWQSSASKEPERPANDFTDADLDVLVDEDDGDDVLLVIPPSATKAKATQQVIVIDLPSKSTTSSRRSLSFVELPQTIAGPPKGGHHKRDGTRSKQLKTSPTKIFGKKSGESSKIRDGSPTNSKTAEKQTIDLNGREGEDAPVRKKAKVPDRKHVEATKIRDDATKKRKLSEKRRADSSDESGDERNWRKKKRNHRHRPKLREKEQSMKAGKLKKTARDPDDHEDAMTEDEENMLEELEIDEPERFKSKTRLRKKKETPFQRKLRKLKAQREGIVEDSTETESSSDGGQSQRTYTSDSAPPSDRSSFGTDDFIVDDGGEVQEGLLPHQFSSNSAQTPEFKFKVVFHYFVLLVVEGPEVLPLRGDTAEYLTPQLLDLKRKMSGFKNSRVRSQIWRANFVKALETYPNFKVSGNSPCWMMVDSP